MGPRVCLATFIKQKITKLLITQLTVIPGACTIKCFTAVIRINQLPTFAARWQHGCQGMFRNFHIAKIRKFLITRIALMT
jgi:hypothetical protein